MNFQQKFGARIKELRTRKGYTQEQLAERVGMGVRSIVNIETAKCFPAVNNLEKIIDVLDTNSVELFDFEHLNSPKNLREEIIKIIDDNPNKLVDIYKIVKALVN